MFQGQPPPRLSLRDCLHLCAVPSRTMAGLATAPPGPREQRAFGRRTVSLRLDLALRWFPLPQFDIPVLALGGNGSYIACPRSQGLKCPP